jgi:feruloyl esterase
LLYRSVLEACDASDGIVDGVVSDYLACRPAADRSVASKRCVGAYVPGTCFTQPQLDFIQRLHAPVPFSLMMANGISDYPGLSYGAEAGPNGIAIWRTGTASGLRHGDAGMSGALNFGINAVC